ncbi:MAG: hypothetical protein KAS62_03955 [Candidatus Delongbacteria bacterium]|nr:hypothetical protein [Candidatus Delongbacteria bacterium]
MRKLTLLLAVLFSIFVWSCGGNSEKDTKTKTEKPKQVEVKKYSIDTEEGMMKKLQEFKIKIPENLVFVEVAKGYGNKYTVKFKAENIDDAARKQLDEWYAKQIADLIADGWEKAKHGSTENETTMGIVANSHIFYKPKGGKSSLKHALSFTSNYDTEEKSYTIRLTPTEV